MNLVEELIGKVTFTEMMLLHFYGRMPTRAEARTLDVVLVTLMEHGITPSSIATRLIYHSAPDSLQSAVAAGLLGVGSTYIGTMERCAIYLDEILKGAERGIERARSIAEMHFRERTPVHGFGHPFHKPDDPRTQKMIDVALEEGVSGRHIEALRILSHEVDEVYGRHITINATGASAALLGEISIPLKIMRGVAVVSRSAGLVGHILEESGTPSAPHIWEAVNQAIPYQRFE